MNVPADERRYWDAAREESEARERPPPPDEERLAHQRLISSQARKVVESCPELVQWIAVRGRQLGPPNATATEYALWRMGVSDVVDWINFAADWKEPTHGRRERNPDERG